MKRVVQAVEVEGDGFESLMGEQICIIAARYIYSGKLVGVNDDCVCISDPHIVYQTGEWTQKSWKDAQKMGTDELFIQKDAIESFMAGK